MDKPIVFKGLENFKVPKCDVLIDSFHDEKGNPFNMIKIKIIPDEFINYRNKKKIGIVPDSIPDKDLIVALLELGDNPDTNDLTQFFKSYGFFLSHSNDKNGNYLNYPEESIKRQIIYIQKIVYLLNSYTIFSQLDSQNRNSLDYTYLCNLFLDVVYSKKFWLYNDNSSNLSAMNENIVLGYDFRDDFEVTSDSLGLPRTEPIFDEDGQKYSEYACYPFNDFIRYRNEGKISIHFDYYNFDDDSAPTWKNDIQKQVYTFLYHLLERKKFKYTENISYDFEDEDHYDYLDKKYKIYEIPHIKNLNGTDKNTISLQNELMSIIQFVINEQINYIIKNIYPKLTKINDELTLSWHFTNITNVIFMELLSIELGEYEIRQCCKEDCPLVGKYYFIVDSKNMIKKCYSQACRNRINKRKYDKKHSNKKNF